MNADDVKVIEKKSVYKGYFTVDLLKIKHRLFEGGWSNLIKREVFERGHAASALLYDPNLDKLVFLFHQLLASLLLYMNY